MTADDAPDHKTGAFLDMRQRYPAVRSTTDSQAPLETAMPDERCPSGNSCPTPGRPVAGDPPRNACR